MNSRPLFLLLAAATAFNAGCGSDDDTEPYTPPPPPELSTIAEARALPLGTIAKVEGFVTVAPRTFFSGVGDLGFALQDDTGGIYVNIFQLVSAPLGSKMLVLGRTASAAGQSVLATNDTGVEKLEGTNLFEPKDVKTGDVGESTEGLLVRIKGNVSKAVVDDKPYGIKAYVNDGSGEVQIFVNLDTNDEPLIDTTKLAVGTAVEITGFSEQYDKDYEIAPRKSSDLVVTPP
jgi:hypothetical protein